MTNILCLPDLHAPAFDYTAIKWASAIGKQYKCDLVIQLGDLSDQRAWSRFPQDPDFSNPEQELEDLLSSLKYVHKYFPEMHIVEGNHCIEQDTEVLTEKGWVVAKNISKEDRLACHNLDISELSYEYPIDIWKFTEEKAVHVNGDFVEELVSVNHSCIIQGKRTRIVETNELTNADFTYSSKFVAPPVDLDEDMLSLLTWVIMDGTIRRDEGIKTRVQFKLSKTRKITALTELLTRMGIPFTLRPATKSGVNKLQPYMIRFYGACAREVLDLLKDRKQIPEEWRYLNDIQARAVLKVIEDTDGYRHYNKISWTTTNLHDMEMIQQMCFHNNIPMKWKSFENKSGFGGGKTQYTATIADNGVYSDRSVKTHIVDGVFNFVGITTPTQTLVTRRNGKITITGNCSRWMKKALQNGIPKILIKSLHDMLPYKGWKWHFGPNPLKKEGIYFIHGDEMTGTVALKASRLGGPIVTGHTHQGRLEFVPMFDKFIWGMECGCLIDEDSSAFRYAAKNPRRCFRGVGVIVNGTPFLIPYPS